MKKKLVLSLCLLLISLEGFSQIIRRDQLSAHVSTRVELADSAFLYHYRVTNDATSAQRLDELSIEVGDLGGNQGGTLTDFLDPIGWYGWTSHGVGQPIDPTAKGTVVWVAADSASNYALLMIPAESSLLPDSSVELAFQSNGLPSIKRFWIRGWARPLWESEYDSLRALGYTKDQIQLPWYDDAYKGFTVAPQLPAQSFGANKFLDTLRSYINQSRTLGWITDDATANKYRRLIDTARFHLEAKNRGITKTKLDSVLVNVHPDSAAGLITSEAYALLRFNTEYVLKKLREEER